MSATSGTLVPPLKFQGFDNNGDPLAGGLLNVYLAGTSTRVDTYTDASLSVVNANPVVLDSAGRASVFLDPTKIYKFVLTDSGGTTIITTDNVLPQGYGAFAVCQGRLTLTTGTPVSDATSAGTLYFTPYGGNRIALYNGATWNVISFTEKSIALGGLTASKNYDIWGYLDANGALALELLVWTSDSARGTALTTQDGILVKTGDATRRYLGTLRTTSGGGAVNDNPSFRGLWNYYNRASRSLFVTDSTDSWTYTTATYRQANGQTSNQVEVVVGVAEAALSLTVRGLAANTGAGITIIVAIGEDSTTARDASCSGMLQLTQVANIQVQLSAQLSKMPAAGYHKYCWLEQSQASGTTTWYGDNGASNNLQSGLSGTIQG